MTIQSKRLIRILLGIALGLTACEGTANVPDAMVTKPDAKTPDLPTVDDCETDKIFAAQSPMRLLTRYEYDNSVNDLFNIDLSVAKASFPPENSVAGFENNSDSHVVSPLLIRDMMDAAEDVAAVAVQSSFSLLVPCESRDAACGAEVVDKILPRAFRRPPTQEEATIYKELFADALGVYDFETALELTLEAILQSPQFLYKIELSDDLAPGDLVQLNSYEVASRLSYLMWATMPDRTLFDAAEANELQSVEQVEAQVRRMMEHPKAEQGIWHFYRQWLGLDALDSMTKDKTKFPEWNPAMLEGWRQSFRDYVVWIHRNQPTADRLMVSNTVFLNPALADLYGETPRGDSAKFSMKSEERAGLLTQPAVLALLSNSNQGSPILRGIFVRERLLCQKLPPPPNDIQIDPPDPDPNATTREIFQDHSKEEPCASCHQMIDPIGLGFENYDGIGRYRVTENNRPVDASGGLFNTVDPTIEGDFDGAVELATRLSTATEVQDCIADHWITYAMGHPESRADMCSGFKIRDAFNKAGSFEDLFVALVTSDTFRYRTVQVPLETEE